mgnify:CR=1 FL=1
MSKRLFEEQQEEDYIQDLIYSQQAEYDRKREYLEEFGRGHFVKRPFSHKNKFRNRRNKPKFAEKLYYPHQNLPF